jgi:hypothetical protein
MATNCQYSWCIPVIIILDDNEILRRLLVLQKYMMKKLIDRVIQKIYINALDPTDW